MDNVRIKIARLCVGLFLFAGTYALAAPFAKTFPFTQPDGTVVELWGEGDEFSAVFEHDGYSVVFDPARSAYMYARLNGDGTELIPTRLEVGKSDPAANGLPEHLRASPSAVLAQRRARFEQWDAAMEVTSRWQARKARMQELRAQAEGGRTLFSPPNSETVGIKVGLTLLIDFDNDPATIPASEISEFLNGDAYVGYGNNGSVKQYFYDVSKELLTYTNVVIAYVRIPNSLHPKSYYNDVSKGGGTQGNALIMDALNILKTLPNYQNEILPRLDALTTDSTGRAIAFNVFYAGGNGGVWSRGLWPHSGGLASSQDLGNGIRVSRYQITNIGNDLAIRTFCHENGHMLCGFPDFYDYRDDGTDSIGGTGNFCLMGYGGDDHNPVQVSAYMKAAAGWADVFDVKRYEVLSVSLPTSSIQENPNTFYRYPNPDNPQEYYIIENRQKTGRDAHLPASGIAVWHIDEDGDRSDERRDYNDRHENFEQTLVQADNQWHLNRRRDISGTGANYGDANDLWFLGNPAASYVNRFTDTTAPSARWWNGSPSRLRLEEFSASGDVMTFEFQVAAPVITTPSALPNGRVGTPYLYTLLAINGEQPYAWEVISNALPSGLVLDSGSGKLVGTPMKDGNFSFDVAVSGVNGRAATNTFTRTIAPCFSTPYEQNFDTTTKMPDGWHQVFVVNNVSWEYCEGNSSPPSSPASLHPATAHSAPNNARLGVSKNALTNSITRLISPMIDFGPLPYYTPELTFWYHMEKWEGSQDKLRVYYSTTPDMNWVLLQEFSSNVSGWTQRRITLPEPSQTFYIAFEGVAMYGYGIHIDDIWIGDSTPSLSLQIPLNGLPEAVINQPYSNVISAIGGQPPYTFSYEGTLPSGLDLDATGLISGTGTVAVENHPFTVQVTDAAGKTNEANLTLSVVLPRATFFMEDFESGNYTRRGWTQEFVTNRVGWNVQSGGGNKESMVEPPRYPHSGNFNATLFWWTSNLERTDHVTRLVSPVINLGVAPTDIILTFWHCMAELQGDQDSLRVYARSSKDDEWTLLDTAIYTNDVPVWTKRTLSLPKPLTSTYQIAFEGNARFGAGVCLDDIRIMQDAPAPVFVTQNPLKDGAIWQDYSLQLVAAGGVEPYTFGVGAGTLPPGLIVGIDGMLSGVPSASGTFEFDVWVAGADGLTTTNRYRLTVWGGLSLPFIETFEAWNTNRWTMEGPSSEEWVLTKGSSSTASTRYPTVPYAGNVNASLYARSARKTLITPMLNLVRRIENPQLTFWLHMKKDGGDQDTLAISYRTSPTNDWVVLQRYTSDVPTWTQMTLDLPDPSDAYQIAFEGVAKWGYGICLDDIGVDGDHVAGGDDGYDGWKDEQFGEDADNDEIAGENADPDGDGLSNIWEYITGRDPNVKDSDCAWLNIEIVAGFPNLSFPVGKQAYKDGVLWDLETCTNLLIKNDWVPLNIPRWLPPDPDTEPNGWWQIIYKDADSPVATEPRRFYRLQVTVPQQP